MTGVGLGDFVVDPLVAGLLATACGVGVALTAWRAGRWRAPRIALQFLAALALLAALSVRDAAAPSILVVATPGASAAAIEAAVAAKGRVTIVALPGALEAGRDDGGVRAIEQVPDLATALRRLQAEQLIVVGHGLRAHDRAAVGDRALAFVPAAVSNAPAILALEAPATVIAGAWWTLQGRVQGEGLAIVLRDPSGAQVARSSADSQGRFALQAVARAAGALDFQLQLRRGDEVLQSLPVPLRAEAGAPVRALLLAAAPSPELKYLRRWALDAGVPLEARIGLAPGLAQRRGDAALDAAQLAQLDLLIVDERSWPQLAALQPALREAVRDGLGLLVRVTGPVPATTAREWARWGLPVPTGAQPVAVEVAWGDVADGRAASMRDGAAPGLARADIFDSTLPRSLHAWPVVPSPGEAVLLADRAGRALATWHAFGRGRVGSLRLIDTHRLYTRGARERHATLWASAWRTLARARATPAPLLPQDAVTGERVVACGLATEAAITAPSGTVLALEIVDGCAAFWPREAGWHRIANQEGDTRFAVRDPARIESLRLQAQRVATQALVRLAPATPLIPGPAWTPRSIQPDRLRAFWLLLWLAAAALLWALERRA